MLTNSYRPMTSRTHLVTMSKADRWNFSLQESFKDNLPAVTSAISFQPVKHIFGDQDVDCWKPTLKMADNLSSCRNREAKFQLTKKEHSETYHTGRNRLTLSVNLLSTNEPASNIFASFKVKLSFSILLKDIVGPYPLPGPKTSHFFLCFLCCFSIFFI